MATRNRAAQLLDTLGHLPECGLESGTWETFVVDNGSSDGTAEQVRAAHPDVELIALTSNRGSCAKDLAIPLAQGEYIVFLDDDSYPTDRCIPRMIEHFEADPQLGAAGFRVLLANGGEEGAALPHIFVGCGVGFRRHALRLAGGLDRSLFMAAEEYDLAFRLAAAGFRLRVFDDLRVLHHKSPVARNRQRLAYHDLRNNLILAATYLPRPWHRRFIEDWTARYHWLACDVGAEPRSRDAQYWGWIRGATRRWVRPWHRLSRDTFRALFGLDAIERMMADLKRQDFKRILFADLGKHIYPYYAMAQKFDLEIIAVMDDYFARPDRHYRGIPIVSVDHGLGLSADAIVISNAAPIQAAARETNLRDRAPLPIHRWQCAYPVPHPAPPPSPVRVPDYMG
jgi:GT2 family glycosyltransferase